MPRRPRRCRLIPAHRQGRGAEPHPIRPRGDGRGGPAMDAELEAGEAAPPGALGNLAGRGALRRPGRRPSATPRNSLNAPCIFSPPAHRTAVPVALLLRLTSGRNACSSHSHPLPKPPRTSVSANACRHEIAKAVVKRIPAGYAVNAGARQDDLG